MECLLCSTTTHRKPVGRKKEPYHFCPHCRLIFKDPSLYPDRETEKKRYDEHNNSPDDPGYTGIFHSFLEEALLPHISPPCRVLDFGSGPVPVLGKILKKKGFEVFLYDPYYAPDKKAFNRKYSLITMTEVMEHLSRPGEELKRLVSCLIPGGCLAVITQMHHSDLSRFTSWWYRQDITHLTFYSSRTMEYIARFFDLEILYEDHKNRVIFRKN